MNAGSFGTVGQHALATFRFLDDPTSPATNQPGVGHMRIVLEDRALLGLCVLASVLFHSGVMPNGGAGMNLQTNV